MSWSANLQAYLSNAGATYTFAALHTIDGSSCFGECGGEKKNMTVSLQSLDKFLKFKFLHLFLFELNYGNQCSKNNFNISNATLFQLEFNSFS